MIELLGPTLYLMNKSVVQLVSRLVDYSLKVELAQNVWVSKLWALLRVQFIRGTSKLLIKNLLSSKRLIVKVIKNYFYSKSTKITQKFFYGSASSWVSI